MLGLYNRQPNRVLFMVIEVRTEKHLKCMALTVGTDRQTGMLEKF